ncbi:branched-chain amino acid transport system permease protein [Halobacterium jilantaiense]|uniref:Branched-chain amino acid transport system permease protein n=1 Tax=Halobacterium jilantaiense TaxID=355548 RepID=A0A1I0P4J7_9EURY|nr:branched-chain amino acid ABC transporter permease [Halobacterium jilantaiense]SEW09115.1 branched-chain amino acid transport system permease protein [Halobacterium jilantaiense]
MLASLVATWSGVVAGALAPGIAQGGLDYLPQLLNYLANGVVFSAIIVLGGIGLSLVYSIADFANFAHGDTMTVGAYAGLVTLGAIGTAGPTLFALPLGFYAALLAGIAVAAVVAVATHYLIYEPLDTDSIGLLITSIGVAFVYRALIQIQFGTGYTVYDVPTLRPIPWIEDLTGITLTEHEVAIVLVASVLVAALHVVLQYTTLGRTMRATADNEALAKVSGIRTERVITSMWVIGAGLAGAGGVFLGLYNQLSPRMGFNLLLVVFAAVILGGIGSVYGAMLGGVVIGMVNKLTPVLSDVGLPIEPAYANAIAFVIMVLVLLVRPTGIAGEGVS